MCHATCVAVKTHLKTCLTVYLSPFQAGLNMVTTNLAIELKGDGIIATAVHPGWVKTDMGGANALISTEESVSLIMNVLAKLQGEDGTGKFYHCKGHIIGW